ncbi:unannotated protein [freshwater metagenome]|uniref:Unannotated protein n=1 Tax=freshwater metagenome TaxID=449393 RepID=A0A6J6TGK3_9ZZZZ|nr:hypothetical protein [Actinomycetota bacterium]
MSVTVVLVAGGGAAWEARALEVLGSRSGVVVLKRCVDVDDLLAASASGQADVAVVGLDAHGLDQGAVDLVRRHGVRPVVVVPRGTPSEAARARAVRIGVRTLVAEEQVDTLGEAVTQPEEGRSGATSVRDAAGHAEQAWVGALHEEPDSGGPVAAPGDHGPGRVVAVWGPGGAPGRSTVATTLAATLAARRRRTVLVDVDPWGGSVAQQLGVLDEVSGLLAAARLASGGVLAERFPTVLRSLGQHLELLTGLPRADRWPEVRDGVVEEVLDLARQRGHVVVDTGAPLERDAAVDLAGRPGRNGTTLAALAEADEVVVVGTADPVGLSRLARGLVELAEETGGRPVHLAVNRMRGSLGWSAGDVEQMVRGFAEIASTTFLPEDQAATDRALVAGRSVVEVGDGPLAEAVGRLADTVLGADAAAATEVAPRRTRRAGGPQVRLRRAGTARRR